jgi:hypothetical protein
LKIFNTERAGGVAQGVGPEFRPQYRKKQNKTKLCPPNVLGMNKEKELPYQSKYIR